MSPPGGNAAQPDPGSRKLETGKAKKVNQNVADPAITRERRVALFVINDLKDKLAEMELHDDLPDSHDIGYMAAWREIAEWANGR